jgi:hypothetical protein
MHGEVLLLGWGGALLGAVVVVLRLDGLEGVFVDVGWGVLTCGCGRGGEEILGGELGCYVGGCGIVEPDSRLVDFEEVFDQGDEIDALWSNKVDVQLSPVPKISNRQEWFADH